MKGMTTLTISKFNKKRLCSLLALSAAALILLTACNNEEKPEEPEESSPVYVASEDTQVRQPQMQMPNSGSAPQQQRPEAAVKTSNVPYDAIEKEDLEAINDLFSEGGAEVFVFSEYDNIESVDADDLFREGIITADLSLVSARDLTDEEREAIEAAGLDAGDSSYITKVTSDQADSFLTAYTGLTVDDLGSFDEFTYVSAYDAWYLSTEDSGASKVTLNNGYVDPDGTLSISYIKTQGGDSEVIFGRFNMEKLDNGYRFLSNEFIYSTSEYTGTKSWSGSGGGGGGPS